MREYPSTLIVPLVAFAVLTAAGVVGVLEASKSQSQHDRSVAVLDTQFTAFSIMKELQSVLQPSVDLGSFISVQPDLNLVNASFNLLAQKLMSQLNQNDDTYLEILPYGHVVNVQPPNSYALAAMGLSVWDISSRIPDLTSIVKANQNSLRGPLFLYTVLPNGTQVPAYNALLCQYPVLVPNVDRDTSFNIPFDVPKACPEDVCYVSATRTKYWGFVGAVIPVDPLLNSNEAGLGILKSKGYNYRMVQASKYQAATPGYVDPTTLQPATLIASYGGDLDDPIIASINVPNVSLFNPWVLMVSKDTWTPSWRDALIASVVIVSAIISILLYSLLLYMNEHARLLHVLMPRKLADTLISNGYDDLVAKNKEEMGSQRGMTMFKSGTPVDKLMDVLTQALMGKVPHLADVVVVRQAIMLGGGAAALFQPQNLQQQLEMHSKLDDDVVRGLVRELRGLDALDISSSGRRSFGDSSKAASGRHPQMALSLIPTGTDLENMETALGWVLGAAVEPGLLQEHTSQSGVLMIISPPMPGSVNACTAAGPKLPGSSSFNMTNRKEDSPRSKLSPNLKSAASLPPGIDCVSMIQAPDKVHFSGRPQPPMADKVLSLLEAGYAKFDFSVFALADLTQDHALSAMLFFLIKRTGLLQDLNLDPVKMARLSLAIDSGYKPNPYHNRSHAADVLQCFYTLIIHSGMVVAEGDKGYCDPITLLACLLAAASHDLEHYGTTNDFLIATEDDLAVLYSDKSPMESHHLACLFKLLQKKELNILSRMPKNQKAKFRKTTIELITATDMKLHFSTLSQFSTLHRLAAASQSSWDPPAASERPSTAGSHSNIPPDRETHLARPAALPTPADDAQHIISLQVALKCADISNLARSPEDSARWALLLEEEFFLQGDRERVLGLPISPLFDREKPGVTSSRVGFYDVVALPLFHNFTCAFPGAKPFFSAALDNYWSCKGKKKAP